MFQAWKLEYLKLLFMFPSNGRVQQQLRLHRGRSRIFEQGVTAVSKLFFVILFYLKTATIFTPAQCKLLIFWWIFGGWLATQSTPCPPESTPVAVSSLERFPPGMGGLYSTGQR